VGQVQPLADLLVGQPAGGELGDLPVERAQRRSRIGGGGRQASGPQLVSRPGLPGQRAELPERIHRQAELDTGLGDRSLAAQPLAVNQPDPG